MSAIGVLMLFIAGILLGFMLGWGAGKERTKSFLAYLVKKMEELRADSKIKSMRRENAYEYGDFTKSQKLGEELCAESRIFMSIQASISRWCRNNNEKDPFSL